MKKAHAQCNYFNRELISYDQRYDFLVAEHQYISMWSYQSANDGRSCVWYDPSVYAYIDPAWKAARAFSVLTGGLGAILLVTFILSVCSSFSLHVWVILSIMVLVNCIAEGLILLLRSSTICNPTYGVCR